jgi:small Trp-rich protein
LYRVFQHGNPAYRANNANWHDPVDSEAEALHTSPVYCSFQGNIMFFIILTLGLAALKYFEVWRFGEISWMWPIGCFAFTFIWFEFLERFLGLDKNKAHDEFDRIRRERVKKEFEQQGKKK